MNNKQAYESRRTFAIISHPDAGKTTMTEKLLLLGDAIQVAGTVKAKKSGRYATSDWLAMEQQRGISVTTSVMQFPYKNCTLNLLDTPGHEDFSEDTYRTLTAVDSALMVLDAAKGVEARTIKLMEVCRLRQTPIITFINKLDREGLSGIDLLDEVEKVLNINCVPITWPIGMGKQFKGVYHLLEDKVYRYRTEQGSPQVLEGIEHEELQPELEIFKEEIELVQAACPQFDQEAFLAGKQTPVFFGSALTNFGVDKMLDAFVKWAPCPQPRETNKDLVKPQDKNFTGFVFKIQANMDPNHRDRMAFLRICSGEYQPGIKVRQVRTQKDVTLNQALTFMAGDRQHTEHATAGDIIGLHNHGTIQIGDTFTTKDEFKFQGIPNFAPELFKRVQLKDPLKNKALLKGLQQLCEEGATQLFRPLISNDLLLGAVGVLQFDVVAFRLKSEYRVDCYYEAVTLQTVRWVSCDDEGKLAEFKKKVSDQLALDNHGNLVFLAKTYVNLSLTQERWPDIKFDAVKEL